MVSLTRYSGLMEHANRMIKSIDLSDFFVEKTQKDIPFAYPCDNYIKTILSKNSVRNVLRQIVRKYDEEQVRFIKLEGKLVLGNNYPRLENILMSCCKILHVVDVPEVYVTNRLKGINALSVGTDKSPMILISPLAVARLSDGEMKFMLGHELGHVLQKNLTCHIVSGLLMNLKNRVEVLGGMVSDLLEVPLREWCRCNEYTADRAGLICCQNMSYVYSIMGKVRVRGRASLISELTELYQDHPSLNKRIRMLEAFAPQLENKYNKCEI